ncbi:MAG: aminopeptidase [Candidatus Thermoplasmatota archaeon]|nr:aminopeptidase [Candidatus Thermoplasmatota archaeon]
MTDPGNGDQGVKGVETALAVVLQVKQGDNVFIVTDESKEDVGDVFIKGAKSLGANIIKYRLPDNIRPLMDIPSDLVNAFRKPDVVINAFSGYAEETPFRIKLTDLEMELGARVGHAPGITMDMIVYGPMQADYKSLAAKALSLMSRFEGVVEAHITAPSGTDFTVNIHNRGFQHDIEVLPGSIGNLPAGEIWCAPVEDSLNGVVVCDGSIGDVGAVKSPLSLYIEKGRLVAMETEEKGMVSRLEKLLSVDDMARIVGELGIGLNPNARITGNLLEDEKAGKTAHIAFGRNTEMPGGRNFSQTHRDFLFHLPTMTVTYEDGSQAVLLKDGEVTGL